LQAGFGSHILDIRVSKDSLERALNIMNAVIIALEAAEFPIVLQANEVAPRARIFGHLVEFSIVEKAKEKSRKEVTEYSYTRTVIDYQPTGDLEFRAGGHGYGCRTCRDNKKMRLEDLISKLVGSLLREGRDYLIRAERLKIEEIERQKKEQERHALVNEIQKEETKVRELDTLITNWSRAQQMRLFVVALEEFWKKNGEDVSPEAQKGLRLKWMRDQANRLDPLATSPASILDRKNELSRW
jgi:hypothetical protein